jgi:hypothetical protein
MAVTLERNSPKLPELWRRRDFWRYFQQRAGIPRLVRERGGSLIMLAGHKHVPNR